ncbi:MAG: DUF1552 domain-containing protein [Verrucomicrobiota bacterium]
MNRKNLLNRRAVLGGLGATLVLPNFESFGANKTSAAAGNGKEPSRFACFYIPGAISQYNWFPTDTGANYTIAESHKPLEHHRDHFSVLTGLSHIEGRISGHTHPFSWLTGHNINLVPGTRTNTISVDQVAAKHIGPTYLNSLVLSWTNGVGVTTLSRNSLGVDIPATGDYRRVFENLFPPADRAEIKKAQERLALNRSILDTATGDIKSVKRKLGRIDQERLDQYLHSVRDVEKRLTQKEAILEDGRPQFDESGVRLESKKNSMQDHIELMTDLIALAFQTDMTRVATQCLGGEAGPNYDDYKTWASQAGARLRGTHDVHHKGGGNRGAENPDVIALSLRDKMLTACIARFMDKLQSIEAAEGTLLDHTAIVFGGAQTASHVGSSFPTILAGGNALGFKHGSHTKWPLDTRPMSDLYLTILQQLGCPVDSFKESSGTISEVLA